MLHAHYKDAVSVSRRKFVQLHCSERTQVSCTSGGGSAGASPYQTTFSRSRGQVGRASRRAAFSSRGVHPILAGTGKSITELPLQPLANALECIRAYKFDVR